MKKLSNIVTVFLSLILVVSCTTQSSMNSANVTALLQKAEFTFVAEHANPTNYEVVNVMNSLPSGSASRMLNLDPGYTLEIKKEVLEVTLPYFGRMYRSNMDPQKNSYRFTSKDFTVTRSEGKKDSSIFTIKTEDQSNINSIIIEAYKNGKTYVSIDANDRQAISYDGYITENAPVKK
ncbi:DUF4251 domain-containing protein [Chryseobacterium sp. SNU WT5]|uniref:DUF4251 domain-containing protein n=1 Tax=Chryseobacterium sp. SNU WT5 TaxID=2594269 RepID=UPI00117CAB50|nr:DUF4251 domain-containing protein [Chryseobacterium sp. SNU WT5]QDP85095.1 DUF4251 domain-containing protein [Chryseobacterium sp. SNU WT5]